MTILMVSICTTSYAQGTYCYSTTYLAVDVYQQERVSRERHTIELYNLSAVTTASVPRIELPTTETVIGMRCDADGVSIATYSAVYNYDLHELRRPRLRKRDGLVNVGVAPEGFSTASLVSAEEGVIPLSTRAGLELVVMYVYEPVGNPRVGVATYQSVHLVFRDVARGIVQAVEIMFSVKIEAG